MGILYVVATPIGNKDDISKRAIEVLENVDLILCEDTRNSSNLLNLLNIKNKLVSYHKFNEVERSKEALKLLQNGQNIAIITDAGTPCISDPGSILVNECLKNNILVYSIPGPNALITALSSSGLTISNFAFYGFLERKNNSQKEHLKLINDNDIEIVVFYESPKRVIDTLKNILEVMDNPYVVILNDLTKKFERKYYGKTKEVLEKLFNNQNASLGEYVIIVSKNKKNIKEENNILTPEAILVDILVKEKCTLKDAIKIASQNNKIYSKNEYYNASLNLKRIL
ncbi:MAG: 16S rRNA (cytidine(1402)-2'-O)-methyltransferase [Bacilli bacterium]|nr:16S rRNA (cytidine(1402)-2'-O)-methyltransferase [Bacilli bacterium]